MEKIKYLMIVAIGLLFAISSCSESEERVRTLEVEQASLTLNKDEQTKTVEVTVDKNAQFTAEWDGGSWGTVTADNTEGVVKIALAENSAMTLRTASIIVTLEGGFRNKVIKLTQNGGDPILSVVPDEISFDFVQSELIVDVESTVEWSASSDVLWLDVETFMEASIIIVKSTKNEAYNVRSTTMTITAGSSSKEVVVRQGATPLFMLPYLDTQTASFDGLVEFEKPRHSIVMKSASKAPIHSVATHSPFMPSIICQIDGTAVSYAGMEYVIEKHMPGFFREGSTFGKAHDFMAENNFEFLHSDGVLDCYWREQPDGATYYLVIVNNELRFITYNLKQIPPEHPNTPTFDAFPYMPLAWGSQKDVVKTWEAANRGVLIFEEETGLEYNVPGDPLYNMRTYSHAQADGKLWRVDYVFNALERNKLFLVSPYGYTLNHKLEAMLANEGFVYLKKENSYPIYRNAAKEIEVKLYMVSMNNDPSVYYGVIAYIESATVAPAPALPSSYKVVKGINIVRE